MTLRSPPPTVTAVSVSAWVRRDLTRPELPTNVDERWFLTVVGVGTLVIAQVVEPGAPALLALAAVATGGFVLRAWWPPLPAEAFAAIVAVPVAIAVGGHGVMELLLFLDVLMVMYVAWSLGSLIRGAAIAVATATAPVLVAWWWGPWGNVMWWPWSFATVLLFVLGRTLQRQQDLVVRLRGAQAALADQAVADERRRIARELHDLAGHTVAAMLLHVNGARHVLRRDVDEADRALADAVQVGRDSLDQIRATVTALRTTERGTDPPLPDGADLVRLVDEYRRAGLRIDDHIGPDVSQLTGPTAVAVHRIAREALANVARHAPTNDVVVEAERCDDVIALRVVDHGRAAPAAADGTYGLVGMRERARALGGRVDAAPTADGWSVVARLPVAIERGGEP